MRPTTAAAHQRLTCLLAIANPHTERLVFLLNICFALLDPVSRLGSVCPHFGPDFFEETTKEAQRDARRRANLLQELKTGVVSGGDLFCWEHAVH